MRSNCVRLPPRGYSLLVCYFLSHSNHGDLASSLQPGITEELYFSFDQEEILRSSHRGNFLEDVDEEVMKRSVITPDFERKERVPAVNQSRYTLQKMRKVCNPHSTKFSFISLFQSSWQNCVRCITNLSFLRLRERSRLARHGLTCQHHRSHPSWRMTSRLSRCVPPWTPPATTRLTTPRKLPDTSRHVHLTLCSSVFLVSSQVGVEESSLYWSQFCFSSPPRWDVWWVGQQTSTLAESLGDGRSRRWWRSCLLVKSSGGTSWHTSKKPTSWIWISSATKVTGS